MLVFVLLMFDPPIWYSMECWDNFVFNPSIYSYNVRLGTGLLYGLTELPYYMVAVRLPYKSVDIGLSGMQFGSSFYHENEILFNLRYGQLHAYGINLRILHVGGDGVTPIYDWALDCGVGVYHTKMPIFVTIRNFNPHILRIQLLSGMVYNYRGLQLMVLLEYVRTKAQHIHGLLQLSPHPLCKITLVWSTVKFWGCKLSFNRFPLVIEFCPISHPTLGWSIYSVLSVQLSHHKVY